MSFLGEIVVKIAGDNSGLDTSIDKSKSKFEAFGKSAEKIGRNLTKFVTLPILAIGAAAVKSAADMEMQEAAFTTLLGSAEKAKNLLTELADIAATTPFQLTDLADATKTMLAFGIAQEEVLPNLQMLGDIAQGNKDKLNSLTLAFSQIQSTGRLMGQDLLQLINAGFNPLKTISEQTGESMAELKDRMSAGAISADEVAAAFKTATSEGGLFYKGMETASQTLTGQFSTLKDNVVATARSFGEVLLPTLKEIVSNASEIAKKFTDLDDDTKRIIISAAGFAAVVGPLALTIGKVTLAVKSLTLALTANPYILAIAGIVALGGAIFALTSNLRQEAKERKDLEQKVQDGVELTSTERIRLSELNIERLKGIRLLRLRALEAAKTLNQGPAALQLIQDQINKAEAEIALEALKIKSIYDGIDADRRAASERDKNTVSTDGLTDATVGLTYEQKENTVSTDENTDAKDRNTQGGKKNQKVIEDTTGALEEEALILSTESVEAWEIYGSMVQVTIADEMAARTALDNYRDIEHQKELDRIEKEKQARIDLYFTIASQGVGFLSALDAFQDVAGANELARMEAAGASAEELAEKKKQIAEDDLKRQKAIGTAQVIIDTASAIIRFLANPGGWAGVALSAAAAVTGAVQLATIQAQEIPSFAQGGIVMPSPGGTIAQVAEAGQPEVIFPLDKLDSMLSGGATSGGGDINMVINLDSNQIYSGIFPATRDRRILIDARAVI